MNEGKVLIVGDDSPSGALPIHAVRRVNPMTLMAVAAALAGPVIGGRRSRPPVLGVHDPDTRRLFGISNRKPRTRHVPHSGSKEAARRLRQMERQKRG